MAPNQNKIMKLDETYPEKADTCSEQPVNPRKHRKLGLWTHEGRLFNEKIVFLNKSTTKYVIIGIDPVDFSSVARICDRVTGTHVSMRGDVFGDFLSELDARYDGSYALDRLYTGPSIKVINDLFWISNDNSSVALHKISVGNLVEISHLLYKEVRRRDKCNQTYKDIVDKYRDATARMNPAETTEFLRKSIKICNFNDEYDVLFSILTNIDYLDTLDYYKENFFRIIKE